MRMRQTVVAGALALAAVAGGARAEDVVLEGVEVRSHDQCMAVLAEFNWVCQEFETPGWQKVYGIPFWEQGKLLIFMSDFDGDQYDDTAMWINHTGTCYRYGCSFYFLFGNVPEPERLWSYDIPSWTPSISLAHKSGENFLRIGGVLQIETASETKIKVIESMQLGLE